jgi:DNA-binding CsgD family transcriptional regulator
MKSRDDRRTLEGLTAALTSWAPGAPPAATWFLAEMRSLLRAEFAGAYCPVAIETGWSLDFMYGAGDRSAANSNVFRQYVAGLPPSEKFLGHSNPHLVEREQRNQVLPIEKIPDHPRPLFQALGISNHDQLRILICDGPRELSWVGATRPEPFTNREVALLRKLSGPLKRRLRLERQLGPRTLGALFDAVLEALGTPAFVIGPRGVIEATNSAGVALLGQGRKEVLDSIAESGRRKSDTGRFSITRVHTPGWPAYTLAIRKPPSGIIERVMEAQRRWGLSVRQARVLDLVANGASNKEIGQALSCAEVTVENHLTELFRRSGARSRAGLVGRLIAPFGADR